MPHFHEKLEALGLYQGQFPCADGEYWGLDNISQRSVNLQNIWMGQLRSKDGSVYLTVLS